MSKLKVKRKATIHNKHHLVLTDARTDEVKQEAWAYNIILEQGFDLALNTLEPGNTTNLGGFLRSTHLGTGTGTLDPTRTTLFEYLDDKGNDNYDEETYYSLDAEDVSAQHARVAVWDETEIQNEDITEVGIGDDLCTHALIEDAEGNPIVVEKGELDILTVYSIVYLEVSEDVGDNFDPINSSTSPRHLSSNDDVAWRRNYLVRGWLIDAVIDNRRLRYFSDDRAGYCIAFGTNGVRTQGNEEVVTPAEGGFFELNTSEASVDYTDKSITIAERLSADEGNFPEGIKEVGVAMRSYRVVTPPTFDRIYQLWRSTLPVPGIWESFTIEDEEIGEGDGTKTEFNLGWNHPLENTETIKIDGLVQDPTDYAMHNGVGTESGKNNIPLFSRYLAVLEDTGEHAVSLGHNSILRNAFEGDIETRCRFKDQDYDENGVLDQAIVITIDSVVDNSTEQLRIYQGTLWGGSIAGFKLQGSDDGDTWSTIVDDEVPNSVEWHEFSFTEEEYRYWRLLIESTHATDGTGGVDLYEMELLSTKPHIIFDSPPSVGDAVTGDYDVEYIPKDENYVLDVEFAIQLADANA